MKELKKISDLTPDDANANLHTPRGLEMLDYSLEQFGAGRGVVSDKNGKLIAGNATVERAMEKGFEIQVVKSDGKKLIVVQRVDLDLDTDPRARALAIADNRVAEVDLKWDATVMASLDGVMLNDRPILEPFFFVEERQEIAGQENGEPKVLTCPHCNKHFTV